MFGASLLDHKIRICIALKLLHFMSEMIKRKFVQSESKIQITPHTKQKVTPIVSQLSGPLLRNTFKRRRVIAQNILSELVVSD